MVTSVAVCCDVGPAAGLDGLRRCLALAEELVLRGVVVTFLADAPSVPWAQAQIEARALPHVVPAQSADDQVAQLEQLDVHAVVHDSTSLSAQTSEQVRRTGRPTLALVDGDLHGLEADVVVDLQPDADRRPLAVPTGTTLLAGIDYALLRNDVLANRPISPPAHERVETPRVLAFFGDTDEDGVGPAVARALVETGWPFEAGFIVPSAQQGKEIAAVRPAPRQRLVPVEPSPRLAERVARADVVLSDAGPSAYELLCLGAAAGLVRVDDGQLGCYRSLMVRRAVVGLGAMPTLRDDPSGAAEQVSRLLGDARERSRLAETGWRMVDGLGRARVADALLALL
ncbi:MAG: spore coat protein [Actinomycetota bacterium]|nr:spore coat protein [Actinomycetota bacterium]